MERSLSIKTTRTYYNERKTICKKRCLVLRRQKKIKKKNTNKTKRRRSTNRTNSLAAAPFVSEIAKLLLKKI